MYTQGHNKQNSTNRQKGLRQNKLKKRDMTLAQIGTIANDINLRTI